MQDWDACIEVKFEVVERIDVFENQWIHVAVLLADAALSLIAKQEHFALKSWRVDYALEYLVDSLKFEQRFVWQPDQDLLEEFGQGKDFVGRPPLCCHLKLSD